MIQFLPIMFASGRVSYNRAIVTLLDLLTIYSFYLAISDVVYVPASISLFALQFIFYVRTSYVRYFKLVGKYRLIKTAVHYDNGFISAFLTVQPHNPKSSDDQSTIQLKVKTAFGGFYQRYVLYIYMCLSHSLTLYARKLKEQEARK